MTSCTTWIRPGGWPIARTWCATTRVSSFCRTERGSAMTELRVVVPVATVWTRPEAVRPVDAPAVAAAPDLAAWTAAMGVPERLDLEDRVVTQALLGEPVTVEETRAGWARVTLRHQPSSLD